MKRLLLAVLLLVSCWTIAAATDINVSSFSVANSHGYNGNNISLRIYYTGCAGTNFLDSIGNVVQCGNVGSSTGFYKEITVTNTSGTLNIPAFTIPSTDDSSQPTVLAHGVFFVNNARRDNLFTNWIITNTLGSGVSFAQLYNYQPGAIPLPLPSTYLTAAEISALINSVAFANASDVVKGITKLNVAPQTPTAPVAVGTNWGRLNSLAVDASEYGDNLSTAVSSIGAVTKATLAISRPTTVSGNVTVTPNIELVFKHGGYLDAQLGTYTVTIQGPMQASPIQIFYNYTAGGGTISFSGNKSNSEFYPEWWGAIKDDGLTDNAHIQATINAAVTRNGATVRLLAGRYNITNLVVAPSAGQHFVSLVGDDVYKTILETNITSGVAITLYELFAPTLKNFSLVNASATRGTSYGVACDGPSGSGTQVVNGIVDHLMISSFSINWSTSSAVDSTTSSEFTYTNLDLRDADTGFLNANFNGLNHNFHNLFISSCDIGVHAATAGVYVRGGAASANDIDFWFESSGSYDIEDFRTETWITHFLLMNGGPSIHVRNVIVGPSFAPSPLLAVAVNAQGGIVHLTDSSIDGRIETTGGSVFLENLSVADTITNAPFFAAPAIQGIPYSVKTVIVNGVAWPDEQGVVVAGFPLDSSSGAGRAVAFASELNRTFPAQVARAQVLSHNYYQAKRTLGATAGNTTLLGTIGTKALGSGYVFQSTGTKEFLVRVIDSTQTSRVFAIVLNIDELAFAPLNGTWQEVGMFYGSPFRSGSYALDIFVTNQSSITLRLRRVTSSAGDQLMDAYLETYSYADTFTPSSTTGTGGTVSGTIALTQISPVITFSVNDTAPNVRNGVNFKTANSAPTTITIFPNCVSGQSLNVIAGDANTTFANNATIFTGTGAAVVATSGSLHHFVCDGTVARRLSN